MKTFFRLLGLSVFSIGAPQIIGAATLMTFDDLSPGPNNGYLTIANGYAGLQWSGFGVFDGAAQPVTYGYRTGMVTPNNVAFNYDEFDRSADISSSSAFDLDSAYLTAAFSAGLEIGVEGFVGANLTYQNIYTVNKSGPEFINFNYLGVNEVRFIPLVSDIFVMDNLTISQVPEPGAWALLAAGAILAGVGARRKKGQKWNLKPACPRLGGQAPGDGVGRAGLVSGRAAVGGRQAAAINPGLIRGGNAIADEPE